MCGTMNYDVDLDETGGWTKCRLCKAVTCSMDEWKKHTVSVPLSALCYPSSKGMYIWFWEFYSKGRILCVFGFP